MLVEPTFGIYGGNSSQDLCDQAFDLESPLLSGDLNVDCRVQAAARRGAPEQGNLSAVRINFLIRDTDQMLCEFLQEQQQRQQKKMMAMVQISCATGRASGVDHGELERTHIETRLGQVRCQSRCRKFQKPCSSMLLALSLNMRDSTRCSSGRSFCRIRTSADAALVDIRLSHWQARSRRQRAEKPCSRI